jgi:hypothetical protein
MKKHVLSLTGALALGAAAFAADPLSSWNNTAPKKAIIDFVERVTKEGSADFVKPEERIATFDNGGTTTDRKFDVSTNRSVNRVPYYLTHSDK